MPLKILITGGGIAGLSLAYNLSNANAKSTFTSDHDFRITLIERHPTLRASGLQIDLRGHAIEVLKRMGLENSYREKVVDEKGLAFVDESGRERAFFGAGKNGGNGSKDGGKDGVQGFSTDWEIMRGDLCRLLYGGINKHNTEVRFGVWVMELQDTDDGVRVVFSDGKEEIFDLVVGADGIGSWVRRLLFGGNHGQLTPSPSSGLAGSGSGTGSETGVLSSDPFVHSLGVYIGYFTVDSPIPPTTSTIKKSIDPYTARIHLSTSRRILFTRRHNSSSYQIYIILVTSHPRMVCAKRGDVVAEKSAMAEILRGASWKADEIIQLMNDADDFYCDHLGVVRLDSWSQGSVVLLGDAAYAPSATTGMGSSSALVGSYVLAGELVKHCFSTNSSLTPDLSAAEKREDILSALKSYEDTFRPFMADVQDGIERGGTYWDKIPSSRIGVAVVYFVLGIVSFLRLDVLANFFIREKVTTGWVLPGYELEGLEHGGS
ncbi:uncharacterized protein BDV14DRAFT_209822 [Aspergillus stella-maris]|uniref:uncharacterized protein n=1 Tax=Aspergillus stella-maris TaxID=1810926 RepID=UPI003CCDC453